MPRCLSRVARWAPSAAAVTALAVGVSGCFTGDRPTLADGPAMTGDPAVDAVLERLDRAPQAVFTVEYTVLTRFGGAERDASVVQAGPARRSITVGSVRFIIDDEITATCDLETGVCTDTIDAARISDTQLSPDFYATSAATRLRRDAAAKVVPTVGSTETIGGAQATCVAVPVTGRTETYCALDDGPIARIDAADVAIELTSYTPTPDTSQLEQPES